MNILSRLWSAFAGLADAVTALAATVADANVQLRQRAGLDAPAAPGKPALPAPADGEGEDAPTAAKDRRKVAAAR